MHIHIHIAHDHTHIHISNNAHIHAHTQSNQTRTTCLLLPRNQMKKMNIIDKTIFTQYTDDCTKA